MINQEAFTYCWTDHKTNKLYVGYHKGRQDDGYICSSKLMLGEYNKRPVDFTRQILAEGTTEDCRKLEEMILKTFDAARSEEFYNRHNGGKNFSNINVTLDTRKKLSRLRSGEGNFMYGKHHSEYTKQKMRAAHLGVNNQMFGKHHTEETKQKLRTKRALQFPPTAGMHHIKGRKWYNFEGKEKRCYPKQIDPNWRVGRLVRDSH